MSGVYAYSTKAYTALSKDEDEEAQESGSLSTVLSRVLKWFVLVLVLLMTGSFCFFAGRKSMSSAKGIHLDTVSEVFEYNATFGEASRESDQAWKALFPPRGGLFSHPTLAPKTSAFSVFHQLKCLNVIRKAYWRLEEARSQHIALDGENQPNFYSNLHMQICIDYLRQALTCQPDLTLEIADFEQDLRGFGTEHQCKNWSQLKEFTTEWETWSLEN